MKLKVYNSATESYVSIFDAIELSLPVAGWTAFNDAVFGYYSDVAVSASHGVGNADTLMLSADIDVLAAYGLVLKSFNAATGTARFYCVSLPQTALSVKLIKISGVC